LENVDGANGIVTIDVDKWRRLLQLTVNCDEDRAGNAATLPVGVPASIAGLLLSNLLL